MRVLLTCSQAYLGAAMHLPLADELNAGGKQRPIRRWFRLDRRHPAPR